ncbi:hypothetical protein V5799_022445 [Amblyomma americanum]|uniref:Uncharacterized protein n=1 Tax=Amblyomma americanum TaxID=6943 RepID=A0AAQ4FLX8_AMBAM
MYIDIPTQTFKRATFVELKKLSKKLTGTSRMEPRRTYPSAGKAPFTAWKPIRPITMQSKNVSKRCFIFVTNSLAQ